MDKSLSAIFLTAITSGCFYRVGHSRITVYEARAAIHNVQHGSEKPTSIAVGETQRGGELRECIKPPLSRGNRGVLCAFRHRSIMHRVHDRPTDRLAGPCRSEPRDDSFPQRFADSFAARTWTRRRPCERYLRQRERFTNSSLSGAVKHRVRNRLAWKNLSAGFARIVVIKDEGGCSH